MRKDPNLVLKDTYDNLIMRLDDIGGSVDEVKAKIFDEFLGTYEGYDILEVVCREAAVLLAYERLSEKTVTDSEAQDDLYREKVIEAAQKYASSEDWPGIETSRAKAFVKYVQNLSI